MGVNVRFGRAFRVIFYVYLPFQVARWVGAYFQVISGRWYRLEGSSRGHRVVTQDQGRRVLLIVIRDYF